MTLEQLIEERIRIDYSQKPEEYQKWGITSREDFIAYKIMALISEKDKAKLEEELKANRVRVANLVNQELDALKTANETLISDLESK